MSARIRKPFFLKTHCNYCPGIVVGEIQTFADFATDNSKEKSTSGAIASTCGTKERRAKVRSRRGMLRGEREGERERERETQRQ